MKNQIKQQIKQVEDEIKHCKNCEDVSSFYSSYERTLKERLKELKKELEKLNKEKNVQQFKLVGYDENNKVVKQKLYDSFPSVRSMIQCRTKWEKQINGYVMFYVFDLTQNKAFCIGPTSMQLCASRTLTETEVEEFYKLA
jgi:DNA repair exonuclease SbcCD ATPase subunit